MSDDDYKPVMTLPEVAVYLRIHRTTVYKLLRDGKIPAFRIGSDWRFNREQIEEWLRGQQIAAERLVKR